MEIEKSAKAVSVDPATPATLTHDQAAHVAGGLALTGSLGPCVGVSTIHMCCLTCASYGRPLFSAVAAVTAT